MAEAASVQGEQPPSDPEALRKEIALVRDDLANNIRQLRGALDVGAGLRRTLRAHPRIVIAAAAVGGTLLALAIGSAVKSARRRRALHQLLEARANRSWWLRW